MLHIYIISYHILHLVNTPGTPSRNWSTGAHRRTEKTTDVFHRTNEQRIGHGRPARLTATPTSSVQLTLANQ